MAADPRSLEAALAALRRDPSRAVRATVDDLTVELRAVPPAPTEPTRTLGEALRGVTWRGDESLVELLAFFAHARQEGGAGDPAPARHCDPVQSSGARQYGPIMDPESGFAE